MTNLTNQTDGQGLGGKTGSEGKWKAISLSQAIEILSRIIREEGDLPLFSLDDSTDSPVTTPTGELVGFYGLSTETLSS